MQDDVVNATVERQDIDLGYLSITTASAQIRSGAVSPIELLEATLARIDATEPVLNSYVQLMRDSRSRKREPRRTVPVEENDSTPARSPAARARGSRAMWHVWQSPKNGRLEGFVFQD